MSGDQISYIKYYFNIDQNRIIRFTSPISFKLTTQLLTYCIPPINIS